MVVVLPLQKENDGENGDASGEQGDIAPCLHGDDDGALEEEGDCETAEQGDNNPEGKSVCSEELEGTLTDSELKEQLKTQSPPSNQQEPPDMEDEKEDGRLSNNGGDGTTPNDMQDLPLPAEVKVTPSSSCEGGSPPASPPGGGSPTALDHQEDAQANQRRSIVIPMEGSGNESFEVILCGGEMEAPIAVMEAPTKPANGRKGKRRSKAEGDTNGDGSLPSKSTTVLKSPVKSVGKRTNEGEVGMTGDGSLPSKSTTVLKSPVKSVGKRSEGEVGTTGDGSLPSKSSAALKSSVKGVGKKRKKRLPWWLDVKKKSKPKRPIIKRRSTQESEPSATSSAGMNANVLEPISSVAPVPFIAPSQAAQGTSQGPSSNFQIPLPISSSKRKTKLVPSKRTRNWQTDCKKLDMRGSILTADLNEVEVFSVEDECQSLPAPSKRPKGQQTKRIKQRT